LALAALIPGVYLGLTKKMWLLLTADISGFLLTAYSFSSRRFNWVADQVPPDANVVGIDCQN